ncbi:MAG: PDZ domain-containing protein [Candidatus Pacearchaeota archaeon]
MKIGLRIWILLIAIVLSLLVISPSFEKGVQISYVTQNSTAYEHGLRAGEVITSIDGQTITNFNEYSNVISSKFPTEQAIKLTITTKDNEYILFSDKAPEIVVRDIPKTRIQTGLDLRGGARALVEPEVELSSQELNDLIAVTSNRLNVYGLSDISIRQVSDLSGKNYMLVEIAGSTPSELENLISKQGKFEAKIGNETVFVGGNEDITYVARTGEQSGIYSCDQYQEGYVCQFRFAISLSEKAAQKQADVTNTLSLSSENPEYLSEKLSLYLDDNLVDSLFISKDLKGRATTQISIQGSGSGTTKQEAYDNAMKDMKNLQTVLITGSLPFKLNIVKLDTISPLLGEKFINSILLAGLAAILVVALIVFIRYRKLNLSLAVLLTSFSEVIIILGIASLIKWNLDLPSIAGIIATIGTGVDQQIVVLDESQLNKQYSLKERIKRALFIIMGSYFTSFFSLAPLYWAGAGLLKGFAVTTIIGITSGILITRPAFAEIVKRIIKD